MRLPEIGDLPAIFAVGFLAFALYHVALNFGERTVSAGAASLLINTAPIFTALLATVFLGERLRAVGWFGMVVSLLGATLISVGEEDRKSTRLNSSHANISYAVFCLIQK